MLVSEEGRDSVVTRWHISVSSPPGRFWLDSLVAGRAGEDCLLPRRSLDSKLPRGSSLSLCSDLAFSPSVTAAWRRLPPPSRMVLLFVGLGPGSRPPLLLELELLLLGSLGGLPVVGCEELSHRQGFSYRDLANTLNLGL